MFQEENDFWELAYLADTYGVLIDIGFGQLVVVQC